VAVDIAKVYIEAEDRTGPAFLAAGRNIDGLITRFGAARAAIATGGAAISGALGASLIAATVKAHAEMDDLSEETQISVERLSQIRPIAAIAGRALEDLAGSVTKFNKSIQEARNDPESNKADLFKKLGIDISKAKNTDDILKQTIQRFSELNESVGKSAAAQELFSKGGARQLSLLKDLSEAGLTQVRVTSAQAAEAERVEKNVRALGFSFRQSAEDIGTQFVPATSALTQTLREMREEGYRTGGGFKSLMGIALTEWAALGAIGLAALIDVLRVTWNSVVLLASGAGALVISLGAVGNAAIAAGSALSGNFIAARSFMDKAMAGFADSGRFMKDAWAEFKAEANISFTQQVVANLQEAQLRMAGFNLKVREGGRDLDAWGNAGKASFSAVLSLMEKGIELTRAQNEARLKDQQDVIQRELAYEEFLHNAKIRSEQEYIDRKAALRTRDAAAALAIARNTLAAEQQLLALTGKVQPKTDGERVEQQKRVIEHQMKVAAAIAAVNKAARDLDDVEKNRSREQTLAGARELDQLKAIHRETDDYLESIKDQSEEMRFQVGLIGETELAQRKANAERRLWLELREKEKKILREIQDLEDNEGSDTEIRARRRQLEEVRAAMRQAVADVGKALEEEAAKQWTAGLSRSITDALVDGGKDAAPRIWEAIQEAFKNPIKVQATAIINRGMNAFMDMAANWMGRGNGQPFTQYMQGSDAGMYGFAGNLAGGAAGRWAGAGDRGQALAASYGGAGAMIGGYIAAGTSVGGPWGAVIGAVVGILAGIFSDPSGNAQRRASFGTNPAGEYSYRGRSAFGSFGTFDDRWFSDSDMGQQMQQFLAGLATIENRFAGILTTAERNAVRTSLSGSSVYSFGEEHADFGATLSAITRDRMTAMIRAVMPGFEHFISELEGSGEDFVNAAQALIGLRDASKTLGQAIAEISGNSVAMLTASLDAMNTRVSRAQEAVDEAFTANDPTQMFQAEQNLTTAILERYRAEIDMVRQLEAAMRQLEQEAYQFALNIAGRINAVGGSRDVGGIAMGRATALRGRVGTGPLANQIEDLEGYVGAIDTWYNARRSQIERDIAVQQEAGRAVAQAQYAAAQARITQLQTELEIVGQFQQVLDRARDMIDDMRLSSANPLHALGRLSLAREDVARLREEWQGATGQARVDAANRLLEAIQRARGLGQEALQRPSPEWQALYNELMADLTAVEADAMSLAEQAVQIQARILEAQQQAAAAQAATAINSAIANAQLAALDQEALGYYTWAESEGARLYAQQQQNHRDQLNAITGGMEIEAFIADRQAAAVLVLERLDARIAAWLAASGAPGAGAVPPPGGTTTTTTTTGTSGLGRGPFVFQLKNSRGMVIDEIRMNPAEVKRILDVA
jgi:hypothetical protein